jgi:hypothetical protein
MTGEEPPKKRCEETSTGRRETVEKPGRIEKKIAERPR